MTHRQTRRLAGVLFSICALAVGGCGGSGPAGGTGGSGGGSGGGAGGGGGGGAGAGGGAGGSGGGGGAGGGGGGAVCALTNITSATTASCYECMKAKCCAQMQACDQNADCLFCIDNPIDSSSRCVDPATFTVYPERSNLDTCQTTLCVPPCGTSGGSACTPADCAPSCQHYSTGCQ